ncbi:MAG: hypothetical protein OEZ33_03185 [Gammaproteobacteria bacterium]|nr:hypothetical protein [Gammaproteobacteria bacterium]MDH5777191.1 hypothetical protein [Gammaproteobacteria bacterium]
MDTSQTRTSAIKILLSVSMIIGLSACSSNKSKFDVSSDTMDRTIMDRYSFIVPYETGWNEKGRNRMNVALQRNGRERDEVYNIQAIQFRLPEFKSTDEFIKLMTHVQSKKMTPPRYDIKKHKITAYPKIGKHCIRSHRVIEDNGPKDKTKNYPVMIISSVILTCPHPNEKEIGINLSYSHHYRASYKRGNLVQKPLASIDERFTTKADKFIDSLKFK